MTMKTLRMRTWLCLTFLMCVLFVGKSVAQEEGEPPLCRSSIRKLIPN